MICILYVEISRLHARLQAMQLSGGCSKFGLYHRNQDWAKLLGDELVALAVGVHLVALQHGVRVTCCTRDVGDRDRGLCSGVLLNPARDLRINRLDGPVAPLCRYDVVSSYPGNKTLA